MDTLTFLYRRRFHFLDPEHYFAWAEHLLNAGHESDSVVQLLGCPDMHWQNRNRCIECILSELGIEADDITTMFILEWQEREVIKKFLIGEISAEETIHRGQKIAFDSGFQDQFITWEYLDEDLFLLAESGQSVFFNLKINDLDNSLRKILQKEGKLPISD
ncbi:MAG: hypothetical protein JXM70_22305 [Pirellulales bacterium]|nr:hypothetical protein [Pirellulales bacterium]